MKYLYIEDIVPNAFISLLKKKDSIRKISTLTIYNFGFELIKILSNNERNAVLVLSKDETEGFIDRYANIFILKKYEGVEYFELLEDVDINILRQLFRTNLTVDLAKALNNETVLNTINILR